MYNMYYININDLVLLTELQNELKSLFSQLEKSSVQIGLRVNEDKIKYMVVCRQNNTTLSPSLSIGHYNFSRSV